MSKLQKLKASAGGGKMKKIQELQARIEKLEAAVKEFKSTESGSFVENKQLYLKPEGYDYKKFIDLLKSSKLKSGIDYELYPSGAQLGWVVFIPLSKMAKNIKISKK